MSACPEKSASSWQMMGPRSSGVVGVGGGCVVVVVGGNGVFVDFEPVGEGVSVGDVEVEVVGAEEVVLKRDVVTEELEADGEVMDEVVAEDIVAEVVDTDEIVALELPNAASI